MYVGAIAQAESSASDIQLFERIPPFASLIGYFGKIIHAEYIVDEKTYLGKANLPKRSNKNIFWLAISLYVTLKP